MIRIIKVFFLIIIPVFVISYFLFGNNSGSFLRQSRDVQISENLSRQEIAEFLAKNLSWREEDTDSFSSIWSQMQWIAFGNHVASVAQEEFGWSERQKEILLTSTAKFSYLLDDPLSSLYVAGEYSLPTNRKEIALVAGELVSRVEDVYGEELVDFVSENLTMRDLELINEFVERERELLPDLVPLPAQDIVISEEDGNVLLRFSTVYYNQGRGPLELVADQSTAEIRQDIERDVFQRIYHEDGGFRERIAGNFLWHQEHLHYHFEDFAIYDLEVVEVFGEKPDLSGHKMKSTFCIRDVSKVSIDVQNKLEDAKYLICGKELQGISVGWADTYFYNYPDQLLNITDLPSGIYSLTFTINPENRFDEVSTDNNVSKVVLDIDMNAKTVSVVSEEPSRYPEVEHIYPKQDCKNCTL